MYDKYTSRLKLEVISDLHASSLTIIHGMPKMFICLNSAVFAITVLWNTGNLIQFSLVKLILMDTHSRDTKNNMVGARVLPGLGRRL